MACGLVARALSMMMITRVLEMGGSLGQAVGSPLMNWVVLFPRGAGGPEEEPWDSRTDWEARAKSLFLDIRKTIWLEGMAGMEVSVEMEGMEASVEMEAGEVLGVMVAGEGQMAVDGQV